MSALQQTGAISLIEIANEFGVTSGARSLKAFIEVDQTYLVPRL